MKANQIIKCCQLTKLLQEINSVLAKNNLGNEESKLMTELIYLKLEKENKLCGNCGG